MRKGLLFSLILALVLVVSGCGSSTDSSNNQADMSMDGMDHMDHGSMEDPYKDSANYNVTWDWANSTVKAGDKAELAISVKDKNGKAVEKYDIVHEQLMHMIIVSKDLSSFAHLHPTYTSGGVFKVEYVFPQAGEYTLFADFTPTGSGKVLKRETFTAAGVAVSPVPLVADYTAPKTIDGVNVKMSFDHLMAGMELGLKFTLTDAATGKDITTLQPYLGAVGHVVIVSEDTQTYIHVHPTDESQRGPTADFMAAFPTTGKYKVFAQFQYNGKLIVAPFVVEIP
jgi:hypothetical protein